MSTHDTAGAAESSSADRSTRGRSVLGTFALALTAVSIIGFVILAIGSIAEWKGFSDDPNDNSVFADVVWSTFALGGLLALLAGIAAWVRGRGRRLRGDVRAGQMAVGWVVLAILLSVIVSALE
jgi:hypothetical protein